MKASNKCLVCKIYTLPSSLANDVYGDSRGCLEKVSALERKLLTHIIETIALNVLRYVFDGISLKLLTHIIETIALNVLRYVFDGISM